MRYQAIRQGCKEYHQDERAYDEAYVEFFAKRCQSKWDNPDYLDNAEINNLIAFLDKFQAWGWPNVGKTRSSDFEVLPQVLENLRPLRHGITILNVDFNNERTRRLIINNFVALQKCGPGNKSWRVAASKILHAINPELFLMWDNPIQSGYKWPVYTMRFLPQMQQIAKRAVNQIMAKENVYYQDAAAERLESCIHINRIPALDHFPSRIAKVIDEYNFMKYTRRSPTVRKMEQVS